MVKKISAFFILMALLACAGCGYTTKSNLSKDLKSIYVSPIKNGVNLSGEINEKQPFRTYRPGLEVDLTNAIINRFVFDGNLKVAVPEKADLVLEGTLVDYRRDAVRYTSGDDVQEYRLNVIVELDVYEARTHKKLWHESSLAGDASYYLSGSRATTEDDAATRAVEDLARRVVDKTIEVW